jgi:hypothetical protein
MPPVSAGGEWLSMSGDASAYSPVNVTRDDRLASVAYSTNYLESRDLLAPPHAINFSITPVPDFNPTAGFNNGMRSATVSFVNNSYDSSTTDRRGAPNPAPIVITQYAPALYNQTSTLPVGNDRISASATSYSFTANTNLQGWGVRAYDGPYTPGKTPIASQDFAPQNPSVTINPAAPAQPYTTTLNLPANTSVTNSRPVYFYYHSNEFPNHDPAAALIGVRNQDYMSPNQPPVNGPGGGDFIIFDNNNRLQIGNITNGNIAASLQGGNVTTNLAHFKVGSAIGFDGNGQFGGGFGATTGSIRFNPISGGRQVNSWGDILAFNNQANPALVTAPGTYIGDANYSNYNNLRNFGMHDPCRLIGYNATDVRAWTEAQYNTAMSVSQWRIATAMENVYLVGGSLVSTFNPTNPPTNWIRNTIFGYTWSSIVGYSYSQGTGPNDWNFEVPNVLPTQINLPVAPGGQPLVTPGVRIPGTSIRYSRGELGFDSPLLTNFWSGTVAYNSYDTGQLAYSVVRNLGVNIFPSYQRGADFGMPVRCVRR